MLLHQKASSVALYGVGVDRFGRSEGSILAVTFGMITSAITTSGNLLRMGIVKRTSKIQLSSNSSVPVVAYCAPTGISSAISFLVLGSQATLIPLSFNLTKDEVIDSLEYVTDIIFVDDHLLEPNFVLMIKELHTLSADVIKIHYAFSISQCNKSIAFGFHSLKMNIPSGTNDLEVRRNSNCSDCNIAQAYDEVLLLRTSGTTSKSKLVPLTNNSVVANGSIITESLGITNTDIALNAMPLFHIGGLSANILAPLSVGGATILVSAFNVIDFVDIIENGKPFEPSQNLENVSMKLLHFNPEEKEETAIIQPTWYHAVPTMHTAIVEYISNRGTSVTNHKLRFIRTGAAHFPHATGLKLREIFGTRLVPSYSMTEQMPICQAPKEYVDFAMKVGTVGRPVGCTVGIFDESHNLLPAVTEQQLKNIDDIPIGELCISGHFTFSGYLFNDAANLSSFFTSKSGTIFFNTGDLGYLDRDGFLFLTGRNKEMIKKGGEQVSPFEVEEALSKVCPFIKTILCFGVPSTLWGEQVGVAIVLNNPNLDPYSTNGIKANTRLFREILRKESELNKAKYPDHVIVLKSESELVNNAAGKFVRIGLAKHLKIKSNDDEENEDDGPKSNLFSNEAKHRPNLAHIDVNVSPALRGVTYILAWFVCWNHLFDANAMANNERSWFHHEAMFFWLCGFNLASSNFYQFDTWISIKNFYIRTSSVLFPLYWFSLLFCIIFFLIGCNPTNYEDTYEYGRSASCQATPIATNWYVSFFLTVLMYVLNLQVWIFFVPFTWFLHWYTWFISVYFALVVLFPFIQRNFYLMSQEYESIPIEDGSLARMSKFLEKLALWSSLWLIFSFALLVVYIMTMNHTATAYTMNWWALGLYMFPLRWLPSFAIGVGGFHFFRLVQPGKSEWAESVGFLTDFFSYCYLIGAAVYWGIPQNMTPFILHDLETNMYTQLLSRLWQECLAHWLQPIAWFWMLGLGIGRGFTAKLMERSIFVDTLAPASFGMFLFQQPFGQLYYIITRPGRIWLMLKKIFVVFSYSFAY